MWRILKKSGMEYTSSAGGTVQSLYWFMRCVFGLLARTFRR
jgi:hypothetical protein